MNSICSAMIGFLVKSEIFSTKLFQQSIANGIGLNRGDSSPTAGCLAYFTLNFRPRASRKLCMLFFMPVDCRSVPFPRSEVVCIKNSVSAKGGDSYFYSCVGLGLLQQELPTVGRRPLPTNVPGGIRIPSYPILIHGSLCANNPLDLRESVSLYLIEFTLYRYPAICPEIVKRIETGGHGSGGTKRRKDGKRAPVPPPPCHRSLNEKLGKVDIYYRSLGQTDSFIDSVYEFFFELLLSFRNQNFRRFFR